MSDDTKALCDDIHSCSYYCERPACIKAQRDELRGALDALMVENARLREALAGVIREADRDTDAFILARALLAAPKGGA